MKTELDRADGVEIKIFCSDMILNKTNLCDASWSILINHDRIHAKRGKVGERARSKLCEARQRDPSVDCPQLKATSRSYFNRKRSLKLKQTQLHVRRLTLIHLDLYSSSAPRSFPRAVAV